MEKAWKVQTMKSGIQNCVKKKVKTLKAQILFLFLYMYLYISVYLFGVSRVSQICVFKSEVCVFLKWPLDPAFVFLLRCQSLCLPKVLQSAIWRGLGNPWPLTTYTCTYITLFSAHPARVRWSPWDKKCDFWTRSLEPPCYMFQMFRQYSYLPLVVLVWHSTIGVSTMVYCDVCWLLLVWYSTIGTGIMLIPSWYHGVLCCKDGYWSIK